MQERSRLAFKGADLDRALAGQKVLIQPNSPSEGVYTTTSERQDKPVERLAFSHSDDARRA